MKTSDSGVSDGRPILLYVEDDAHTFKIAALRLRSKYRVLWARTDEEACTTLETLGGRLHAVLLDVELSGSKLDGLELVRVIRGTAGGNLPPYAKTLPALPKLPVIVLTAYTGRYSESEVLAVGASHFVTKPIDFARLHQVLAQPSAAPLGSAASTNSGKHARH